MTKMLMNVNLLEYQRVMQDGLQQVIQRNFVCGVRPPERMEGMEPALSMGDVGRGWERRTLGEDDW